MDREEVGARDLTVDNRQQVLARKAVNGNKAFSSPYHGHSNLAWTANNGSRYLHFFGTSSPSLMVGEVVCCYSKKASCFHG